MKKIRVMLVGLIMVLAGSFCASRVQSQNNQTKVMEVDIAGKDGNHLSGMLFVPQNATDETPAPIMITVHGYLNQKETQSNFSIEFARRGYVVLEMDMAGHGSSEQIYGDMSRGISDAIQYARSLSFVDKENIGIEGHSMGGWSSVTAAIANKEYIRTLVVVGSAQGNLEMGNVLGAPAIPADARFNYAVLFAEYDEFVGLNYFVEDAKDFVKSPTLMQPFGTTEPVVLDKVYGSFEDGTARMAFSTKTSHVGEHQSHEAIGKVMSFVNQSTKAPITLSDDDQIWQWKELSTAIAYIGLIVFMIGIALYLFTTVKFAGLIRTTKTYAPLHKGIWSGACIIIIGISALTFIPLNTWATNQWLAKWKPGNPFSEAFSTTTVFYLGVLQVIFVAMFILWHFLQGKKKGADKESYGLITDTQSGKVHLNYLGKAFGFALIVVSSGYGLLCVIKALFLVDVRWWMFCIRTMNAERFWLCFVYFIPFLIIFLANGLLSFGWLKRKEYESETKNIILGSLFVFLVNIMGIGILIIIQLVSVRITGKVAFASGTFDQLLIVLSYGFIPLYVVISVFSTYCYRKTKNIYTGAILSALITTWFMVCYQPIGLPFYM